MVTDSPTGQDPPPELSVVVASHNARGSVRECLKALMIQRGECRMELLVVDNSTDGTDAIVSKEFPEATLIRASPDQWIPILWETGIRAGRGALVALTTAHCIPDGGWIKEIVAAHRDHSYVGIGGAIDNDEAGALTDWAVYLCRYARYMRPFEPYVIHDIPADNASYKRWALDRCTDVRANGFWEPDIHAKLIRDGYQLWMTPRIAVRHRRSFTFGEFMSQRFWHGRQFGASNAERLSLSARWVRALAAPVIPLTMWTRIARHLIRRRRYMRTFVLASPILACFLLSWAMGEAAGYVTGTSGHP